MERYYFDQLHPGRETVWFDHFDVPTFVNNPELPLSNSNDTCKAYMVTVCTLIASVTAREDILHPTVLSYSVHFDDSFHLFREDAGGCMVEGPGNRSQLRPFGVSGSDDPRFVSTIPAPRGFTRVVYI